MRAGTNNTIVKPVVLNGVLEPQNRYTEEEKDLIIKAYQERSSMRGIERTHGVYRQTLSAWLNVGSRMITWIFF